MAHPWHHALSSARKFGGKPEDYLEIHNWFDASKAHMADFRHRMLRHHSEGIFSCEKEFGITIINSDGKHVPVRLIAEQHVSEDFAGFIPSLKEWMECIQPRPWMMRATKLHLQFDARRGSIEKPSRQVSTTEEECRSRLTDSSCADQPEPAD
jgi:hypothetical protein